MASRRRTLLFLCALGFGAAVAPVTLASATPVQDPGAATTTTVAVTTTVAESKTNQTLVESEDTPDKPVFTENRKVAAIIGGLVLVALALLLLTVRYIRVTKPRSSDDVDPAIPMLPPDLELDDDSIFVDEPASPAPVPSATAPAATVAAATASVAVGPVTPGAATAAPGTDHDAADDDWQPRTGEHERVEIPTGTALARPGLAARRRALGVDPV